MELTSGQKSLLLWQILIGNFGIWPALYAIGIYAHLITLTLFYDNNWRNMIDTPEKIGAQIVILLWFLTLSAGLILWVIYLYLYSKGRCSQRFGMAVTWATLMMNLTLAALCFTTPTLNGGAPWTLTLTAAVIGLYPLLIAWLWYGCFVVEPARKFKVSPPSPS